MELKKRNGPSKRIFGQSLGDVYRVHLNFCLFGCTKVFLNHTYYFFVESLVVYSIQKSWLAISGVIKLPIFWESNNTNLRQFCGISLITMHCSGW